MKTYEQAVKECLAKEPKREDYARDEDGILPDRYFEDKRDWQIETIATLKALGGLD